MDIDVLIEEAFLTFVEESPWRHLGQATHSRKLMSGARYHMGSEFLPGRGKAPATPKAILHSMMTAMTVAHANTYFNEVEKIGNNVAVDELDPVRLRHFLDGARYKFQREGTIVLSAKNLASIRHDWFYAPGNQGPSFARSPIVLLNSDGQRYVDPHFDKCVMIVTYPRLQVPRFYVGLDIQAENVQDRWIFDLTSTFHFSRAGMDAVLLHLS